MGVVRTGGARAVGVADFLRDPFVAVDRTRRLAARLLSRLPARAALRAVERKPGRLAARSGEIARGQPRARYRRRTPHLFLHPAIRRRLVAARRFAVRARDYRNGEPGAGS